MPATIQLIVECVRETQQAPEQLTLVVGKPGSGKSKIFRELAAMRGWEYVDCGTLLTEEFLELVPKARPMEAPVIMGKILAQKKADVILLDGIQVLFAPVLNIDPLLLMKQLSKKQTILAAWPGEFDGNHLLFHQMGQKDNQKYEAGNLKIIELN